ncbi:MAG: NADH-quinone oxidoreductase subunit C [Candidatus Magnetominusculus sp. LBB02]|nr:NADH-quinone oxidoreductase subunit C [Candidatus Magnetominusculus sp. LBB02]
MKRLAKALKAEFGDNAKSDGNTNPVTFTVAVERFADAAKTLKESSASLCAEWTTDDTNSGRGFSVYACYREGSEYLIIKAEMSYDKPEFPSLVNHFVPANRFERQIRSLMGVIPRGLPDSRPWIKFEDWPEDAWPLRKSFDVSRAMARCEGQYAWIKAEGEGVYEIPVGPVHAGIIEPGHFRFQAVGETIINLEERLGYVHKGIEKRFESMTWETAVKLAGRVSGDTTVAHSLAYCMALESMTHCRVPDRAKWLRALFLERERIANHLGDIGAICNDAAFAFMLYQCSRLKETMLSNNLKLFGHRFIMDRIIPGGVTADIDGNAKKEILSEMDFIKKNFDKLVRIYEESSSLEDRVRNTGILSSELARELCVVGVVARASGLNVDCRVYNHFSPYDTLDVDAPVLAAGDVHARIWVRIVEIRSSMRLLRNILRDIPAGGIDAACNAVLPDSTGFAAIEGWRGEIIYWLQSGNRGEINRCMVRDPSSVNWLALEKAIHGNIVPDFPLCNKSFNQSYSGHDL